jgi:hypothetical protein
MKKIIGDLTSQSTSGEKKLFYFLEKTIAAKPTTYCYYEPLIDDICPDFLIIDPEYGIINIEIKDFHQNTLVHVSSTENWHIAKDNSEKSVDSPFNQLYNYWKVLKHRLDQIGISTNVEIPILQMLALPYISSDSEIGMRIRGVQPSTIKVLFKENLRNYQTFQAKLEAQKPPNLQLTKKQLQVLRGNLIPTSRLPSIKQAEIHKFFLSMSPQAIIKLLDRQQEQLACALRDGHRLIFGVAGSGKTVVVIARARYLALSHPDWRILILCYNRNLSREMTRLINPQDYAAAIEISTFHKWAKNIIYAAGIQYRSEYMQVRDRADEGVFSISDFFQKEVPLLLDRVIDETSPQPYDAILIDEAQDFEKEWFTPVLKLLNSKTSSLLITCDGLQGIYARRKFYWKDVGIQAVGRTSRFNKSYRIPKEIGTLAYKFVLLDSDLSQLIDKVEGFLESKEFSREGGTIDLKVFLKREDEYNAILRSLLMYLKKGFSVLILFPRSLEKVSFDHPLIALLNETGVNWHNLKKIGLEESGIWIGTLQGTKGLETDVVIIPELDRLEPSKYTRQLLYVGMTRARHELMMTASRERKFVDELTSLLDLASESER